MFNFIENVNGRDTFFANNILTIDSSKNDNRNKAKNFVANIDVAKHPAFAENALHQWLGAVEQEEVEDFFNDLKSGKINRFFFAVQQAGTAEMAFVEGEAEVTFLGERILNLTQHPATPEQVQAGVFEPADKKQVQSLLTFDELPSKEEVQARAKKLADVALCEGATKIMIGGAPFFMEALSIELRKWDMIPVFSFSKRESIEVAEPDGSVIKKSVFRHTGFVEG